MIVRNWMQRDPVTVEGDTLVSEAKKLITESRIPGLPVVDGGRLRGLLTQAHCLRALHHVTRGQDPDELDFFVSRLKVKDIMVRNPATVDASDTMEHCVRKGRTLGVSQFPVLEAGRVVGMISANEMFELLTQLLGALEERSGLTLAPVRLGPGTLGRVVGAAESAGAVLQAVYPIGRDELPVPPGAAEKRVILRFDADNLTAVAAALEAAGFQAMESFEAPRGPAQFAA
jgi:acetoin utilization protein AcuB